MDQHGKEREGSALCSEILWGRSTNFAILYGVPSTLGTGRIIPGRWRCGNNSAPLAGGNLVLSRYQTSLCTLHPIPKAKKADYSSRPSCPYASWLHVAPVQRHLVQVGSQKAEPKRSCALFQAGRFSLGVEKGMGENIATWNSSYCTS
jgi:hypothetical protein